MFCEKCGKEVLDEAIVCVHCGCSLNSTTESDVNNEPLNGGVQVLSFCFPIVGGIVWMVHKNSAPQKSKDACVCALWGVGVNLVLNILFAIGGGM
jgi:hypothetical protein